MSELVCDDWPGTRDDLRVAIEYSRDVRNAPLVPQGLVHLAGAHYALGELDEAVVNAELALSSSAPSRAWRRSSRWPPPIWPGHLLPTATSRMRPVGQALDQAGRREPHPGGVCGNGALGSGRRHGRRHGDGRGGDQLRGQCHGARSGRLSFRAIVGRGSAPPGSAKRSEERSWSMKPKRHSSVEHGPRHVGSDSRDARGRARTAHGRPSGLRRRPGDCDSARNAFRAGTHRSLVRHSTRAMGSQRGGAPASRGGPAHLRVHRCHGIPGASGECPGSHARADRQDKRLRLTPTEAIVARMVASGEPNKGVAQRLMVSRKAVEHHLTNIYAKLGITSRTQLAARYAQVVGEAEV